MNNHKKTPIRRLAAFLLCMTMGFTLMGCVSNGSNAQTETTDMEYVTKLFGSGVINIEIKADPKAWAEMLANAEAEEYISCDVTVNGTTYTNVGIRPKGNSSLSQVTRSDNDRYSFRLKFDKYVEDQTCFGLSTFVVNNMYGDPTYMKEYLSYDIMNYAGVDTPLYEFANISVNDQAWGFYLAVEVYDDEFLTRTYGDTKGELYNVKMSENKNALEPGANVSLDANSNVTQSPNVDGTQESSSDRGQRPDFDSSQAPPENWKPGTERPEGSGMGGRGGMGAGNTGGSLQYVDDNAESYPAIFDNNVFNTTEEDQTAVIEALKALSEGRALEQYFDIDQILRYFAAHTVVVNLDSYSSNMAQNYYLYERGGQLTVLPWDYNLAWGGFQGGNASNTVNFPIDTPVSGISMEERPLLQKLLENEEYLETYHKYLQEITTGYLSNIQEKIAEIDSKISAYVEKDATAFYTFEEYKASLTTLTSLIQLRAESIQGQLDGTIPSTTQGQESDSSALIDATSINMETLGKMMGGSKGGQMMRNPEDQ